MIQRLSRLFLLSFLLPWSQSLHAGTSTTRAEANVPVEIEFVARNPHADPFNEVTLDVLFTDPAGKVHRVPAFWAGGAKWKARYASASPGLHQWRSECNDSSDRGLHEVKGGVEVTRYRGSNPLYQHGPIRVAEDRHHLEHLDGTPFFWLGDTWWMALCSRLKWPHDFQLLTADRAKKGFTVIQIVAGLYPDMGEFDPRGSNEAGFPWTRDKSAINPAYFDMADRRIQHLAENGLAPCVVGCWGYYLSNWSEQAMRKHWRYIVARWGAYPVIWCLAGEGTMPYYLSKDKEQDIERQKRGWTEVGRYVHQIDPFHRLVTIHPSSNSRDTVLDPTVLDFEMLQTGHGDRASVPNTLRQVTGSQTRTPAMPVIDAEVCYEGILEASREELQRLLFWACILDGAAGHTYGANGIWQLNTPEQPFGPSPHGRSWGDTPWTDAYRLPGSYQLGLNKTLLLRYEWWRFQPHPEWAEPHWSDKNYIQPYSAGIPGKVRMTYVPVSWDLPKLTHLEPGAPYRGSLFNPSTGKETSLGNVTGDAQGEWQPPVPPIVRDWLIVLDRVD